mgnify:CR=1 FL=1
MRMTRRWRPSRSPGWSTSQASATAAWLVDQPTISAAIASARNLEQLRGLLPVADLNLGADEVAALTAASDL